MVRWSIFVLAKEEETVAALELERDGLQADKQAKIDQAEKDKLEFENIQKEIETKEKTKAEVNQWVYHTLVQFWKIPQASFILDG